LKAERTKATEGATAEQETSATSGTPTAGTPQLTETPLKKGSQQQ
jgi:hypothetical protein